MDTSVKTQHSKELLHESVDYYIYRHQSPKLVVLTEAEPETLN